MTALKYWDVPSGTWKILSGPPGPTVVSADAGNLARLGSDNYLYVPGGNVGRNLLHNSMFRIQQRGVGPWTASGFTADRWSLAVSTDAVSASIATMTDTDRTQIGDEEARYSFNNGFTGNAAAGAFNEVTHSVEDVRRLAGKTVTLSFWAVANTALKLGLNGYQNFGTGGSPSGVVSILTTGRSVTLATSWARYSVNFTIPSASGKTLGTNNDHCTTFQIFYSSGATNNVGAGNIGVQSGNVQLWGMQLEIGTQATPLEKLDIAVDRMECQRFFYAPTGLIYVSGYHPSAASLTVVAIRQFPVTMRAIPSVSGQTFAGSANNSAPTVYSNTPANVGFVCNNVAAGVVGLQVQNEQYTADL